MRKLLISALSVAFALSTVTNVRAETTPITANGTQRVEVIGEEWGAGVTKTVIEFDQKIKGDSVSATDFVVVEDKDGTITTRTIVDAYVSNEKGVKVSGSRWRPATSEYVTIELGISPEEGNPIIWNGRTWRNSFATSYKLDVTLADGAELTTDASVVVNEIIVTPEIDVDDQTTQLYPQLEGVTIDSYTYTTQNNREVVVPYGFYQPSEDGHKNGIFIWNHGIGEGGTDPKIAMYGNEVTALFGEEFQEVMDGCYVLVAQVPGNDRNANRAAAIVELVKELAAANSDIDLDRVYVGGCSAGGGMTATIVNNFADFFAAALPICPAGTIQAENVGDLPLWFIHAENDSTVNISGTNSNVTALREAGKEVHTSIFPNVLGTFLREDDSRAEYDGHWSWVYFFNNECVDEDGVNCWEWLAQQTNATAEAGTQKVVVIGEEWGAGVTKTIITLDKVISGDSVSAEDFIVAENKDGTLTYRTIVDAYVSDAEGVKKTSRRGAATSQYITIELAISPEEGNPIIWDGNAWRNNFAKSYKLYVNIADGASITTKDSEELTLIDIEPKIDIADETKTLYPQMEKVTTGVYTYEYAGGTKTADIPYGFYQPDADGHKNGIIVWNHGIGEGGTDPKIAMYGNEVTALFGEEFQEVMDGCYVLVAQVPGNDRDANRAKGIVDLVTELAEANSDIDLDRVYVAGCSAGGGMTATIVNNFADFFAAALPICPAGTIQAENVGDLPLWFIHAENDSTVNISGTNNNVTALREAGKEVHTSIFPNVLGTFLREDGSRAEYDGHWSWVYFFNNECVDEDGVNCWEWLAQQTNAVEVDGTQKVVVIGEEWGAGVTKTIINLEDKTIKADSIDNDDFVVNENNNGTVTQRTITAVYPSDEKGNKVETDSKYITIEMAISPKEGNPIIWDGTAWRNNFGDYRLYIELTEGSDLVATGAARARARAGEEVITNVKIEPRIDIDNEDVTYYPQMENVETDSYTYLTAEDKEVVIPYGFYTPETDDHKNGIIVWNHGIGEGGTDPKIAMYGNEVTALFGEEFQEVMDGCYVLVAQVPNDGARDADRAAAIVELVKLLAAENSDIDLDRVYVAGCSAGGGMTATIVNNFADFFAAALPICPAGTIDVEKVGDLPLWFIHAENDTTVKISGTNTNVAALKEAGKEVHTSIFENVIGTYTYPDTNKKAEYDGHWSWVYFFNNGCVDEEGTNCWTWLAQQTNAEPTPTPTPTPETGDDSAIALYAMLSLASAGVFLAIRRKETN